MHFDHFEVIGNFKQQFQNRLFFQLQRQAPFVFSLVRRV